MLYLNWYAAEAGEYDVTIPFPRVEEKSQAANRAFRPKEIPEQIFGQRGTGTTTVDTYGNYTYTFADPTYAKSRDTQNTFVHLDLGEMAKFAATVANGEQIRWTFDDAVATSVGTGSYTLNVPEERTLDATGAKIHRVAVEADDAAGRYGWSVRKVWHVIYNHKVYIDTTSTASIQPETVIGLIPF